MHFNCDHCNFKYSSRAPLFGSIQLLPLHWTWNSDCIIFSANNFDIKLFKSQMLNYSIPFPTVHDYKYVLMENRIESFNTWPKQIKQSPEILAQVGLFYSGYSDVIICYVCGAKIKNINNSDNPWLLHLFATNNCVYLKFYQKKYSIDCDKNICKICFIEKVTIVFLPCGHLFGCKNCCNKLNNCPYCKNEINNRQIVYQC